MGVGTFTGLPTFQKNNFALLKRERDGWVEMHLLRTSTTHYYFASLTSINPVADVSDFNKCVPRIPVDGGGGAQWETFSLLKTFLTSP